MSRKVPVLVHLVTGSQKVPGEVFGRFAVTLWQRYDGTVRGEYNVTHLPSGCSVSKLWGNEPLRLAVARKLARYLEKHWPAAELDNAGFGEAARKESRKWRDRNTEALETLRAGVAAITDPTTNGTA